MSNYTISKEKYCSPRWSGEIFDCSMPMTFDQYSVCGFDCFYCFSQFQRGIGQAQSKYVRKVVKAVSVPRVKELFTDPGESQFAPLINAQKVIQWGGLSDPFCAIEKELGLGLELLKFFREINYPICFSTKGSWWTRDPRYTKCFIGQKNWNVKVSIITLDDEWSKLAESGAPLPRARLRAMERIANWDCGGATLRLRPFIIGISDKTYEDLIRRAADAGATAVTTEFLCVETRSAMFRDRLKHKINPKLGFNLMEFYKKFSRGAGYLRLNRKLKRKYVDRMQDLCDKLGLRFYVSDAHFKERCHNGSCCGLLGSWNYCQGQLCTGIQIAKNAGKVYWRDIAPELDYAKRFLVRNAIGFNSGNPETQSKIYNMTMFEYLRYIWNQPNNGKSPYKAYEGILKPVGVDEERNVIYEYDPSYA